MQLLVLATAASTIVTTASAISAVQLNADCQPNLPLARVVNRCSYPVYLWSVFKGVGCPTSDMVTLQTGQVYNENLRDGQGGNTGISIKISKTQACQEGSLTQLEYYLEKNKGEYNGNYLDMSFVDCQNMDCPSRTDGYYLVAGNQTGMATANAGNTWCPVMSCHDAVSCAAISYINPNDIQTKTCDLSSSLDLYLCGGEAPSQNYAAVPASSSSSSQASSSSSQAPAISQVYKADAAVVSQAPDISDAPVANIKTEVVYVTKYINVAPPPPGVLGNAKRHPHVQAHARRHEKFNA